MRASSSNAKNVICPRKADLHRMGFCFRSPFKTVALKVRQIWTCTMDPIRLPAAREACPALEISSDEPLLIDRPSLPAKPSRSRSARASSSKLASRETSPRARVRQPGTDVDFPVGRRSKTKAVDADDDEPIFVRSSVSTHLAEKYG